MYCRNCGKPIPEGGEFCMMCGSPVYTSDTVSTTNINSFQKKKEKISRSKFKLRILIIILMSLVIVSLIGVVLLFMLGILPVDTSSKEPEATTNSYDISVNEGILSFSAVIDGRYYTSITYEYDGDEYDEIYSEDFMDEPIDLTLIIKSDAGDNIDKVVIEGFMVIDTDVDDSVRFKYYNEAKALYVYDPNDCIYTDDILGITGLEALYLDGFTDVRSLDDLSQLQMLNTLSLTSMPLDCLPEIRDFSSLVNLSLISLSITDLEGLEDSESLAVLSLFNLKHLESISDTEDLPFLRVMNTGNLPNLPKDDLDELAELLPRSDAKVYIDVIPINYAYLYQSSLSISDLTIGFISVGVDEYSTILQSSFLRFAELEGINVIHTKSDGNPDIEFVKANELIKSGVDALVVTAADRTDSNRTVNLANKAGIPIFFIDNSVILENDNQIIAGYVRYSHAMTGYNLGKWVAKNHPGADCVYIPEVLLDVKCHETVTGFNRGQRDGGMQPITVLEPSFGSGEKAVEIVEELLDSSTDFDVVFVSDENSFEAVNELLLSKGANNKVVVSTFGMDKYWPNLENGTLAATVSLPPTLVADISIQQIVSYYNNESFDDFMILFLPKVLSKDNLNSAIPWDFDIYIEGRINGNFEFEIDYYSSVKLDDYDLLIQILEETLVYMKETF